MNSKENQMATNSSEDQDHHRQYALQIASASVLPMAMKAAAELGVLEIIERAGPDAQLSSLQIASQLPTQKNPHAPLVLDSILCLLASHSILTCSVSTTNQDGQLHRLYGLAPVGKFFTRSQDGGSLAPMLFTIQDKVIMNSWYHLKDAVLEGGVPFDKANGMSAIEYLGKHAGFSQTFFSSLREFNPLFTDRILKTYDGFEGLKSLVDVGGGDGSVLNMIVSKFPIIKGINYDLAPVIEKAPSYPGIKHVAGDMFVSIPKGDAIFMKCIMHGWDDKHCLKILRNCYEALPCSGKIIVVDMVVPETVETSAAAKSFLQFHLYRTSMNPRGKDRTEREFQNLARGAGFSHSRVACCAYNFSVMEFFKNM